MDTVRVVVADDNIQLRDMVAEYLQEQNGIEVKTLFPCIRYAEMVLYGHLNV